MRRRTRPHESPDLDRLAEAAYRLEPHALPFEVGSGALRHDVSASEGRIPQPLRRTLLGSVARLANRIACTPSAPAPAQVPTTPATSPGPPAHGKDNGKGKGKGKGKPRGHHGGDGRGRG